MLWRGYGEMGRRRRGPLDDRVQRTHFTLFGNTMSHIWTPFDSLCRFGWTTCASQGRSWETPGGALNISAVIFADYYYYIDWMRYGSLIFTLTIWAGGCGAAQFAITPEQAAHLPPPAGHSINFSKD